MKQEKTPEAQRREHDELHRRVETDRRVALQEQVNREAAELKAAPVIKVETGHVLRCGLCGCVTNQLYELPQPQGTPAGNIPSKAKRMACQHCHPEVRVEWWQMQ